MEVVMDWRKLGSNAAQVAAQFIFAVNLIFVQAAFRSAPEASPLVFAVGRGVVALITLSAIHLKSTRCSRVLADRRDAPVADPFDALTRREKITCYAIGLCGVTLNLIGVAYGTKLTDAITSGAFQCAIPPVSYVIAYFFGESITVLQVLSLALAVTGNAIMAQLWLLGSVSGDGVSYHWGCLLLTVNVTAYATFMVLQKPFVSRMPKMEFLYRANVSGVLAMLLIAVVQLGPAVDHIRSGALTAGCWASIVFAGAINSVVPYYLIAVGISISGPASAALYFALQPVMVAVLSLVFLGEGLDWMQGVGMCLILAGLVAGAVPRKRETVDSSADSCAAETVVDVTYAPTIVERFTKIPNA